MDIKTDQDITGAVAKAIREKLGLSQPNFWGPLGVSQPSASFYEAAGRKIPAPTRSMIFIRYVAGIKHDTGTAEGAEALCKLAESIPQSNEATA